MQKDFHYYAVAVLARWAGFTEDDALTIAYASQYVDDAVDGHPIVVGDFTFEPLFTANDWSGMVLDSHNWNIQKKVYIPFHFLPPEPVDTPRGDFVTVKNGNMARELLGLAADEQKSEVFRLCRLGVALHTYADTWSHQDFSGRYHDENDVDSPEAERDESWVTEFKDWVTSLVSYCVGHGQIGHLADYPFARWRAEIGGNAGARKVERDNPVEFEQAAREILAKLTKFSPGDPEPEPDWKAFGQCLNNLSESLEERCMEWHRRFQPLFNGQAAGWAYEPGRWQETALGPRTGFKNDRGENMKVYRPDLDQFMASPWVAFHNAARRQRAWVMDRIWIV